MALKSEVLVKNTRSRLFLNLCLILGFVMSILTLFLPWQQSSYGQGRVMAFLPDERMQNIESPVDGKITGWYAVEGSRVSKGDPIVDITDIDPNIMERLQVEVDASRSKIGALEKAKETSLKNVERQRELAEGGLSSQRVYELAEIEYAKTISELAAAKAELARLEVKFSRQAAQQITSPRDGIIHRVVAMQGSSIVKSGQHLATIVPETQNFAVELKIDGNDIPLVHLNRKVRLQFEGWPAVQFVGWPSVAVGTFGGIVTLIDPTDDGAGKFRVIISRDPSEKPWPDSKYLRQGARANGWILLDSVSFGFELWRKFNGFPKAILSPDETLKIPKKDYEKQSSSDKASYESY